MKNQFIILSLGFLLIFGCSKENASTKNNNMSTQINTYPKESLNSEEIESLLKMREEEKLAHDVYLALYKKWGVQIFSNIANSEQSHTDAVLSILNKYELTDPVGINAEGVFKDTTLQKLYIQLTAEGGISLLNAYKVGATIEDLDIYDLNHWISKVDNQDILFVYQNLNKGSRNHLRSFYGQIINSLGTYTAQFISTAELDTIVKSPHETGSF